MELGRDLAPDWPGVRKRERMEDDDVLRGVRAVEDTGTGGER